MKTLYMFKGLPASGKTTQSGALITDLGAGNVKRVNKDDLREMLDRGKWSQSNERFVLAARDALVTLGLRESKHVIVDDTNLVPRHQARLQQLAEANEAAFEVVDLTDVPVGECIERDRARTRSVGENVIRDMWLKYIVPPPPAYDPAKPYAIICDLDGTLFDLNGRNPYDASTCFNDKVRAHVADAVQRMCMTPTISLIFVSGRSAEWRKETHDAIRQMAGFQDYTLYMREYGDKRRDSILKREIYAEKIEPSYNVFAIFDDRPQVIMECWQALGLGDRIFNVGTGQEF